MELKKEETCFEDMIRFQKPTTTVLIPVCIGKSKE